MRFIVGIVFLTSVISGCSVFRQSSPHFEKWMGKQAESYLSTIKMKLSPEEEIELKQQIVEDDVIDTLRVRGEKRLSSKQIKAVRYLMRPVRAGEEINPRGQIWALSVYWPNRLPIEKAEDIFERRGLQVIRQHRGYADTYFKMAVKSGTDPVNEANYLTNVEFREIDPKCNVSNSIFPFAKAYPSAIYSDLAGKRKIYIGKNQITVHFFDSMTAEQFESFSAEENLIILDPRIDYSKSNAGWSSVRGSFFIADTTTVGEKADQLLNRPEVRNVTVHSYSIFP